MNYIERRKKTVALHALSDTPTRNKNSYNILNNHSVCTFTMMTELHSCIGVFIDLARRDQMLNILI